ncbi:SAM-dependent methyltransferase [Methanofollis fontis]|uniref:SAM-dependent methyltransferase n=1 Tax=Methanofollis fontis TaxID=2052832 RepID=A0A483CX22_9EURY|nr:SAM-dependent methyltransferase [Methanofollis fontis]
MPQQVFEEFAEDYDAWFEEHAAEYRAELERVRRLVPPGEGCAVEVGAGSGRFAAPLGIGLGIEPSLALARMTRQRGVEVVRGRAEALPLRDGSCSLVLMVTVICFLDDPASALQEVHRVLAPGGTVVIGLLEREGRSARTYRHSREKGRFLCHARFYSADEVISLLRACGFSVAGMESMQGFCVIRAGKHTDRCATTQSGNIY